MVTRRKFLETAVGAGVLAAGAGCSVSQSGGRRIIVDAQVHLWKADGPDYPWNPGLKPQLPEPFTIERVLPLMDAAGVDRVVVVPPGLSESNSYALEAARRHPGRFAVMGRIPVQNPQGAALLPKWKEQPGMLGLRLTFNGNDAAWLTNGTANWIWPAAEKAGLPVMVLSFGNTALFGPIAARHPEMPLIIDHMGVNPQIVKEGKLRAAIDDVVALSKYPNVGIKVSNLVNASLEPYPFRDLKDQLRRVFDAFGPRRCYWGTDLTNAFTRATWRQRITHITEEMDFLSESDKDWVMGRAIMERLKWA